MNQATEDFGRLARSCVDELLQADPVEATWLGDHRFDDRLPDYTETSLAGLAQRIDTAVTALDAIDDLQLSPADQIDLEILRAALTRRAFEARELRSTTWNPLEWNPGTSLYLLISRDFAPRAERLASIRRRLEDIPRFMSDAQATLGEMPGIHVETALAQLQGTRSLIADQLAPEIGDGSGPDASVTAALDALDGFAGWLAERLPECRRSPRLGERMYAAALWHRMDDEIGPGEILESAEAALGEINASLRRVAAEYLGESERSTDIVRRALADIALRWPVDDGSVLDVVRGAVQRTLDFTRDHDLVWVPEIQTRVIEMPEIHRGVAVAYCDAPGPLEESDVPTNVAVSPTPSDWSAERIASFYREYNAIQLHDLTIHEAFPGHVLQLAHAQRQTASLVRRFGMSGSFVEGWAVYAEELLIERGYAPSDDARGRLAIRLQQLKMQARMTINAILDVRVHASDITEPEALELMTRRGFQEEGEAVGKWRRALLTAGQLPTYFVGYRAVRNIAADLRFMHADWSDRQVHDLMLSFGSPAPRHLRSLLGI